MTVAAVKAVSANAEIPSSNKATGVVDPVKAAMQALLKVEAAMREAANRSELGYLVVNEARKITRARQVLMFSTGRRKGQFKVEAVSSLTSPDRNSPMLQAFERALRKFSREMNLAEQQELTVDAIAEAGEDARLGETYPLRELVWLPLIGRSGELIGGLVLAREIAWTESDLIVAKRLAATATHAWEAFGPRKPRRLTRIRTVMTAVLLSLVAAMFIPVPMSALAPFEIVAKDPTVVAAPVDGVIEQVVVEPNSHVKAGDVLIRYADTTLRNKYDVAEREVVVAQARLKRANQMAFISVEGRRELAIASAELDVRLAERDFAKAMLEKAEIRAPRAGLVVFDDKKEMIGKPVRVGERLLELAEPGRINARIEMPVADVSVLEKKAAVKLFLDSDPLNPVRATLRRSDFEAKAHQGDVVSFRAWADLEPGEQGSPRLGVRGTAQVFGETVPLGLFLFRRPIAATRQWLGL